MKERPILFSAPMVRAILAGTKTQTRRVVKLQPRTRADIGHHGAGMPFIRNPDPLRHNLACPYGHPGDRLWVRETWRHTAATLEEARAITEDLCSGTAVDYRATAVDDLMRNGPMTRADAEECCRWETWKPSIHMPRWASRITLEITGVRVERLQGITHGDAEMEGVCCDMSARTFRDHFHALWDRINGAGSWDANPWVWVVEFKRVPQ